MAQEPTPTSAPKKGRNCLSRTFAMVLCLKPQYSLLVFV